MDTLDKTTEVYLDGKLLEAVVRADTDAGEVDILEKHYSTGDVILNPDGSPSLLTLKGKVEKKPKWDLSIPTHIVDDMAYDVLRSYPLPSHSCFYCGGPVENGYCYSCGNSCT